MANYFLIYSGKELFSKLENNNIPDGGEEYVSNFVYFLL